MKLRYSSKAYRDLLSIRQFGLINFGRAQTDAYQAKLKKALRHIGSYPECARVRSELEMPVRMLPVGSHLIVYEIHDGLIVIIRVLHGSQRILDEL